MRTLHRLVHDEEGAELIEFIMIMPMIMMVSLIGLQLFLAGHAVVVTANAAREGARQLALCRATSGQAREAVRDTSQGYNPSILEASRGGREARVTVRNKIHKLDIIFLGSLPFPDVTFTSSMRIERCP